MYPGELLRGAQTVPRGRTALNIIKKLFEKVPRVIFILGMTYAIDDVSLKSAITPHGSDAAALVYSITDKLERVTKFGKCWESHLGVAPEITFMSNVDNIRVII